MDVQNNHNALPFTTLAFRGSLGNTGCMAEADQNYYFNLAPASNETPHVPTTLAHWIYCQQTPQNYVEFLAETGPSQIQKKLPFTNSPVSSGFTSVEASVGVFGHKVQCQRQCNEGAPLNNLTGSECQVPTQNSNEGYSPAASDFPSTVPSNTSRWKAANADRRRRLRISEGLEALQELLPHPKEGAKASVLDDIIDHIKYLQFQIKELSQSRLKGESSCTPFILLEGYGHYLFHEQMLNGPLEEMVGKLLEVNPLTATQLLESRGRFMMPMALAGGLRPQI